jgi:hypothetical protein
MSNIEIRSNLRFSKVNAILRIISFPLRVFDGSLCKLNSQSPLYTRTFDGIALLFVRVFYYQREPKNDKFSLSL